MEKEFVKYEIALELKELGFDEPCFGYYGVENELCVEISCNLDHNLTRRNFIAVPTCSQAFRFFREKYELYYTIEGSIKEGFQYFVYTYEYEIKSEELFNTYEKTELVCLVKLIEIAKEKNNNER